MAPAPTAHPPESPRDAPPGALAGAPSETPSETPSEAPSHGSPGGSGPRLHGVLRGEEATARLAAALAARLGPGDALLLEGPIGAGKSALARALIRARLGEPEAEVPSPSFTLVQTYGEGEGGGETWHADLHRLGGPAEVEELGLAEALPRALVIVEWPDRLGPLAPPGALRVALSHLPDPQARGVVLWGPPAWAGRLAGLEGLLDG